MVKKKYIFTETGEKRYPKENEYFLNYDETIVQHAVRDLPIVRKILKLEVTEKPKRKAVNNET